MENVKIVRVIDFAEIPGARYRTDGDNSAQEFFEDVLEVIADEVLLKNTETLLIDLDGTTGYPSSFVSELAERMWEKYSKAKKVKKRIVIKSDDDPGQITRFWNGFKKH